MARNFAPGHALSVISVPGWHSCQSVIIVVFIEGNGNSDGIFLNFVLFSFPFPPSVFLNFDSILHESDHKNEN